MGESKIGLIPAEDLLEAAPDGIFVVDGAGRIVQCNRQACLMFCYEKAELIGQPIEVLVPQRFAAKHAEMRHGYMQNARVRPMGIGFELLACRKDGHEVPVEISLSPVSIGGERGAIAIVRDVTQQRQQAKEIASYVEALKRSNEELEQFAYVASHDLQEPLRMVAGYTQLLKRRYQGRLDAEADEFIGYAIQGVKRMQQLISDLLAYSRVTTRAQETTAVDLTDVLDQVEANLNMAITESGARIERQDLPTVEADPTQMVQLFQNLIGNAIKFRGDVRPEIQVTAQDLGSRWEIAVKDNGIGIAPEYAEKIFVIFQRLHNRDDYPGTGIGLAICKKIVERHGGEIRVDSAVGRGSTFLFTLPKVGAPG